MGSSMIAGRSTRMEVLELLRRKGPSSAETIAGDLGVTPNAVRQHLTNLERDAFVISHPERGARGRPALLFSLTERADSVFPKRYGQLASMVLQEVQDMGGEDALDEIFARVAQRHATGIEKELQGLDFDQKMARVVAWIGPCTARSVCPFYELRAWHAAAPWRPGRLYRWPARE